jgi:hypothetical protein
MVVSKTAGVFMNREEVLAAEEADRDTYIRELKMAESAMAQEEASANLERDRRITVARTEFRRALERAWLTYSSSISGKVRA